MCPPFPSGSDQPRAGKRLAIKVPGGYATRQANDSTESRRSWRPTGYSAARPVTIRRMCPAVPAETGSRRIYPRKALRAAATVRLAANGVREATMWDLGVDGLSVIAAKSISPGQMCTVDFELLFGGVTTPLTVAAKVVHCSFVGTQRFKVGMRFAQLDAATADVLARFAAS